MAFGETQAQQTDLGRLAVQIDRERPGLLPGLDMRCDFFGDEAAHGVAEGQVLGRVEGASGGGGQDGGRHGVDSLCV
jgi:hypothetical protein